MTERKRTAVEELAEREAQQRIDDLEYLEALDRFGLTSSPAKTLDPAPRLETFSENVSSRPTGSRKVDADGRTYPAERDGSAPAPGAAEYLSTREAAALLGVSVKHLETLRVRGGGPPYVRLGRAVRYARATLTVR